MPVINRTDGLWSKRYEIGQYFGLEAGSIFVIFGGCTNSEMQKIQEAEARVFSRKKADKVEVEVKDKTGQAMKQYLDPQGLSRQNEAISTVMSRHIIDHNIFKRDEKNPGNADGIKLTAKEVWEWVCDRAELAAHLIMDWRESLPFDKKPD